MIAIFLVFFLGTVALGLAFLWFVWSAGIFGDVSKGIQKWNAVTLTQLIGPPAAVLAGAVFINENPAEIQENIELLGILALMFGPGLAAGLIYRALKGPELMSVFAMAICAPYVVGSFIFAEEPKAVLFILGIFGVPLLIWIVFELIRANSQERVKSLKGNEGKPL